MKYDYKCTNCKTEVEIEHSMKDDLKTHCEACGTECLKRHFKSTPAFSFKGEGWASKDIRLNSMRRA